MSGENAYDIRASAPAYQLILMMNRIYQSDITATSGSNLSIYGGIWITL
ncbi:MAG: hypothetical protein PHC91_04165 [Eubacteriales bacterium]|nr:hypothetical protein [Eubacteriales bacterium]